MSDEVSAMSKGSWWDGWKSVEWTAEGKARCLNQFYRTEGGIINHHHSPTHTLKLFSSGFHFSFAEHHPLHTLRRYDPTTHHGGRRRPVVRTYKVRGWISQPPDEGSCSQTERIAVTRALQFVEPVQGIYMNRDGECDYRSGWIHYAHFSQGFLCNLHHPQAHRYAFLLGFTKSVDSDSIFSISKETDDPDGFVAPALMKNGAFYWVGPDESGSGGTRVLLPFFPFDPELMPESPEAQSLWSSMISVLRFQTWEDFSKLFVINGGGGRFLDECFDWPDHLAMPPPPIPPPRSSVSGSRGDSPLSSMMSISLTSSSPAVWTSRPSVKRTRAPQKNSTLNNNSVLTAPPTRPRVPWIRASFLSEIRLAAQQQKPLNANVLSSVLPPRALDTTAGQKLLSCWTEFLLHF